MRCLIIGGSGQDGILISAQLLAEGHAVTAVSRRPSPLAAVDYRPGDAADRAAMRAIIADVLPDEVYYLAAHHRSSQDVGPPLEADVAGCLEINTSAFASVLATIDRVAPAARTVYASSCRVFGSGDGSLVDESTPKAPLCPYGLSKAAGMAVADVYRRDRRMHVSSAILFNHESELRPSSFLSKKLVLAAIAASRDPTIRVEVGALDDVADWGSARDYAAAMRCILHGAIPGDFVVASGEFHTVRDFAEACFGCRGLDWSRHVVSKPGDRPLRWRLRGNSAKLRHMGWRPSLGFADMVSNLVTRIERHERERPTDFHSYL